MLRHYAQDPDGASRELEDAATDIMASVARALEDDDHDGAKPACSGTSAYCMDGMYAGWWLAVVSGGAFVRELLN